MRNIMELMRGMLVDYCKDMRIEKRGAAGTQAGRQPGMPLTHWSALLFLDLLQRFTLLKGFYLFFCNREGGRPSRLT